MQRWIIAAGVFLALVLAGGAFGYRAYRLNQAVHPVLLQFPIPAEASAAERSTKAELLQHMLKDPALLTRVSKDAGLAKKLRVDSDEAAANELGKRLFVEIGTADTPQGRQAGINIGLNCKRGEYGLMVDVSNHLNKALKHP